MADMGNHVRVAAIPSSVFVTPTTKPTIARAARPAAKCWPIVAFPACWGRIGPGPWKNSKRSNDAETVIQVLTRTSHSQALLGLGWYDFGSTTTELIFQEPRARGRLTVQLPR